VLVVPDEKRLEALIDSVCEALTGQGYAVLEDALPHELAAALRNEALQLQEENLIQAGTGRNQGHHLDKQIRADAICWLEPDTEARSAYLSIMEAVRKGINSKLYLGLFDYECHYARYAPGAFYKIHLDAFAGKRNRVLSTTYYLNVDWADADHGELVLYALDASEMIATIAPRFNSMVIFMSEQFPHEVLPTTRQRHSVAGWFRINTSGS
jgi:SM-20-related protein